MSENNSDKWEEIERQFNEQNLKVQQNPEKELSMNNFWMILPGSRYRTKNEDILLRGGEGSKKDIIIKLDELLSGELANINSLEILKAIDDSRDFPSDETRKNYEIAMEKLRVVYNRLIELGFDENLLRR